MPPASQEPVIAPPVNQAPVIAPAPTIEYTSNPFSLLIKSLGRVLELNGVSGLVFTIQLSVIGLVAYIAFIILMFLHLGLVAFLLFVVVVAYLSVMFLGGMAAMAVATGAGVSHTATELRVVAMQKFWPMAGVTLVSGLVVGVGFVLLIVPGIIFAAWFLLAPFVMVAENLGVMASLKRSRELARGHIWEMLGMYAAIGILGGNGILGGLISPAGMMGRYEQLKALQESGAPKPKVHWSNYVVPALVMAFVGFIVGIQVIVGVQLHNTPFPTPDPYNFQSQSN